MRRWSAILVTATAVACTDPIVPTESGPDPGFVAVSLSAVGPGAGALWWSISGSGFVVDSVRTSGYTLLGSTGSGTEQQIILIGSIATGEVLRFWIPDRRDIASYQATVNEAAAAGTYEQLPTSAFTVALTAVDQ